MSIYKGFTHTQTDIMQTLLWGRCLLVGGNKSTVALMNGFGVQMGHCWMLLDVIVNCAGSVSIWQPAAPLPGQEIATQHVTASLQGLRELRPSHYCASLFPSIFVSLPFFTLLLIYPLPFLLLRKVILLLLSMVSLAFLFYLHLQRRGCLSNHINYLNGPYLVEVFCSWQEIILTSNLLPKIS